MLSIEEISRITFLMVKEKKRGRTTSLAETINMEPKSSAFSNIPEMSIKEAFKMMSLKAKESLLLLMVGTLALSIMDCSMDMENSTGKTVAFIGAITNEELVKGMENTTMEIAKAYAEVSGDEVFWKAKAFTRSPEAPPTG